MPALHPSRRELLGATAATVCGAVAGCTGESTPGSSSDPENSIDPVPDPETASIRGETGAPLVRLATERDEGDGTDETGPTDGADDAAPDSLLVLTDSADREALEYGRDSDGSDDVRELLEGTTFAEESVIVCQDRVGECYERRLEYVEIDSDEFDLQFCRVERDASVGCELEREQLQATFVRVPVAVDAEPTGWSVGVRSSCRGSPAADAGDEEPETEDDE